MFKAPATLTTSFMAWATPFSSCGEKDDSDALLYWRTGACILMATTTLPLVSLVVTSCHLPLSLPPTTLSLLFLAKAVFT